MCVVIYLPQNWCYANYSVWGGWLWWRGEAFKHIKCPSFLSCSDHFCTLSTPEKIDKNLMKQAFSWHGILRFPLLLTFFWNCSLTLCFNSQHKLLAELVSKTVRNSSFQEASYTSEIILYKTLPLASTLGKILPIKPPKSWEVKRSHFECKFAEGTFLYNITNLLVKTTTFGLWGYYTKQLFCKKGCSVRIPRSIWVPCSYPRQHILKTSLGCASWLGEC